MTVHQVHGLVVLAVGAMAVGFAALAGTFGERAAKKPLPGGQLGNAGTEAAFGSREIDAVEGLGHFLYYILYKIKMESKSKNTMRICSSLEPRLKQQWNKMFWQTKELVCGIAAWLAWLVDYESRSRGGTECAFPCHVRLVYRP